MDEVMKILEGVRPDVDFKSAERLIDDAVLDSFDIIAIVGELDDAFDIEIDVADLEPENFNTAQAIWDLVQSLQ